MPTLISIGGRRITVGPRDPGDVTTLKPSAPRPPGVLIPTPGNPGPPGPPNTLAIGDVTSGVTASATITGDAPEQTLNLVLPQGDKGDTGDDSTVPGPPGPANVLSIGTVTEGPAAASITGTAPEQTLNLTVPQGPQGDKGDRGDDGEVTQAMLDAAVATLVDSAPEALNTLAEVAAALGNDPEFATTIMTLIGQKVPQTTTANRVYATTGNGGQTTYVLGKTTSPEDSIALRGAGGVLVVGTPTAATHAATKDYVDTGLTEKVDTSDARLTDQRVPTNNSVTSAKIADGAITNADINANAGILATKLAAAVQASLGKADTAVQNVSGAAGMWMGSALPGTGTVGVLYVVT